MTLRTFLQVVNQHKVLIVVVTLLAGAASFLLSVRQTPRYQAVSQVLLSNVDLPSLVTNTQNPNTAVPAERNAATQAQLARVPAVARQALATAGVDESPSDLLGHSSVASDPSSDLLTFAVGDRHARVAEQLATAYARAFVQYRYEIERAPFAAANRRLTGRVAALRAAGQAHTRLFTSLRNQQEQIASLMALQSPEARVVRPADGAAQLRPRPARALAIGLPIGLLLGLVAALLLHVLDTRTRTMHDAERSLRVPSLGWVPSPPRRFRQRLAMLDDPRSAHAEALAAVRTNVDLARRVDDSQVLLVTTVAGREPAAKSTTVANLAVAFARSGLQVVLADFDLREPSIARLFGLAPSVGLTEVLSGAVDVHDALRPVSLQPREPKRTKDVVRRGSVEFGGTLRILPVAAVPANPTDVIATRGIGVVLEQLRGDADLVLIDAPPLLEGSDAAALSRYVDAIVVIAHVGHDRQSLLAEARRRLDATPATALGFIGTGKRGGESAYAGAEPDMLNRVSREALP